MTLDEERYLRNRSREAITDMFRVIRHLQQINKFEDSKVVRAMISVWRVTEADEKTSFAMLYLYWMARELEKDEESKRRRARSEARIRRED